MQHRAKDTPMDQADIRETARRLMDLPREIAGAKGFFDPAGTAEAVASARFPEHP
jgi:hypothetical protein